MAQAASAPDFFDRARLAAAAGLVAMGILAIAGCRLTWVRFSLDEPARTTTHQTASAPIAGTEVSDWRAVLIAGIVVVVAAVLLAIRRRGLYAWICFFASMVIGAIAVADYRGLGDPTSGFLRGLERALHTTIQGQAMPGVGLVLVAVSGVGGLIISVLAIAATPRRE